MKNATCRRSDRGTTAAQQRLWPVDRVAAEGGLGPGLVQKCSRHRRTSRDTTVTRQRMWSLDGTASRKCATVAHVSGTSPLSPFDFEKGF